MNKENIKKFLGIKTTSVQRANSSVERKTALKKILAVLATHEDSVQRRENFTAIDVDSWTDERVKNELLKIKKIIKN